MQARKMLREGLGPPQATVTFKNLVTLRACETLLVSVHSFDVLLCILRPSEALVAVFTCKWFLESVCPLMSLE